MDGIEHYRRLLRYDHWANGEVFRALCLAKAPSGEPARRALKLLSHIVGAEGTWLARLSVTSQELAVWPELDLDLCGRQIEMLGEVWEGYLSGLEARDLDKAVSYTNSKGQPWQSRGEDILMHVAMHSAYHRGQIAL